MKKFEKYDKEYCDRKTSSCCLNLDIYCEHCEELRKRGWRAALERVLKYANRSERGSIGIIDWLNKELGDT